MDGICGEADRHSDPDPPEPMRDHLQFAIAAVMPVRRIDQPRDAAEEANANSAINPIDPKPLTI